jgi:hypothetical protein
MSSCPSTGGVDRQDHAQSALVLSLTVYSRPRMSRARAARIRIFGMNPHRIPLFFSACQTIPI